MPKASAAKNEAEMERLKKQVRAMRSALVIARDEFARYAAHYDGKMPPDTEKADKNAVLANHCAKALAAADAGEDPEISEYRSAAKAIYEAQEAMLCLSAMWLDTDNRKRSIPRANALMAAINSLAMESAASCESIIY